MSQLDIYRVFCIVVDEKIPFEVQVKKDETVSRLKDLIKEKGSNTFANIDPTLLSLYHVNLADDENLVATKS